MRFLKRWLRIDRPPGVALHPTRTLELDVPAQVAFQRSIEGIQNTLGGIIREKDEQSGTIEATFGLINSERITVSVVPAGDHSSRVVIESRRGVSGEPPPTSQYVDALAEYLQR
ncbi:MAG TPA: hypothetical protein VFE17_07935 [Candidatus Baltobacteraceae bacterium]|jgi:hypothetical protein|nr:hypothetical protein [Candidatus Baltobacteraceae bacterium]